MESNAQVKGDPQLKYMIETQLKILFKPLKDSFDDREKRYVAFEKLCIYCRDKDTWVKVLTTIQKQMRDLKETIAAMGTVPDYDDPQYSIYSLYIYTGSQNFISKLHSHLKNHYLEIYRDADLIEILENMDESKYSNDSLMANQPYFTDQKDAYFDNWYVDFLGRLKEKNEKNRNSSHHLSTPEEKNRQSIVLLIFQMLMETTQWSFASRVTLNGNLEDMHYWIRRLKLRTISEGHVEGGNIFRIEDPQAKLMLKSICEGIISALNVKLRAGGDQPEDKTKMLRPDGITLTFSAINLKRYFDSNLADIEPDYPVFTMEGECKSIFIADALDPDAANRDLQNAKYKELTYNWNQDQEIQKNSERKPKWEYYTRPFWKMFMGVALSIYLGSQYMEHRGNIAQISTRKRIFLELLDPPREYGGKTIEAITEIRDNGAKKLTRYLVNKVQKNGNLPIIDSLNYSNQDFISDLENSEVWWQNLSMRARFVEITFSRVSVKNQWLSLAPTYINNSRQLEIKPSQSVLLEILNREKIPYTLLLERVSGLGRKNDTLVQDIDFRATKLTKDGLDIELIRGGEYAYESFGSDTNAYDVRNIKILLPFATYLDMTKNINIESSFSKDPNLENSTKK